MVAILTTPVFAGEIEEMIKNAPDGSRYENANVLILYSEKAYALTGERKALEDSTYVVKVLNNKGRSKYSDQKISYNTEKDRLTLVQAGTFKKDLSFISIEDKAINDVTPLELADAQVYANYLNRVYSFPVVESGASLLMHYKKTIDLKDDDNISDRVFLQLDEPLLVKKVRISVPSGKKLAYRAFGLDSTLKMEKGKDMDTYTITVREVPMITPEERMPPFPEVAQNFLFSTYQSWDDAAKPFSGKFFHACEISPEITALAGQLTKSCRTSEEKIRAVSLYIAQKVRNVDLALGKVGYEPHKAAEVLKNKYGDCRDKSVLMVTLLRACGIESCPALIDSESVKIVKEVPTLKQFDGMLIAIPQEKGYRFLDPFGDMSQFGFISTETTTEALIIRPERIEFSPVIGYSSIESIALNTIDGSLSEKGDFSGTIDARLFGNFDTAARYQFFSRLKKKMEMYFEETADEFCPESQDRDARRTDPLDLTRNMEVSFSIDSPNLGITQGTLMVINIPAFPFGFASCSYSPSLPARKYPYDLGAFSQNLNTFTIKIPSGYKPIYMPDSFEIKKEYGTFTLACTYDETTRAIIFRKDLKFTSNRISGDEYREFKKNLERFELTQNNLVILKK